MARRRAGVYHTHRGAHVAGLILTFMLMATGTTALAQGLPDGPGRDVTIRVCGQCHDAEQVAAVRLTRLAWMAMIGEMVGTDTTATEEELHAILDYLATHFLTEAARPITININTATNVELESVFQLLRKEAAAVIEYRQKNGKFKSLEDVKKVPGIDFKKIETRKDRLVF